jgi:RNA polymerase sigma factor (sigma-70 family)
MATSQTSEAIEHLRRAVLLRDRAGLTDGQLLEDYRSRRDEAALAALVYRHAPMVWGVCRRVLRHHHDVEDAFQATFLVLVRKAASIASPELLANWLYGVAHQTALKARATAAKRGARERQVKEMPEPDATEPDLWNDLQPLLDQELSRLPEKYRVAIVLCDLEGKTRTEAARQLGVPEGTLAARLARGRVMLAKRLARHGLAVSGVTLPALLSQSAVAGVPNSVVDSTIKAASHFAAGQAAAVPAKVALLTEGVLKAMLVTKLKKATAALLFLALIGGAGAALLAPKAVATPHAETKAEEPEQPISLTRSPRGDPDANRPFNGFPVLKRPPLIQEPGYQSATPQYAVLAFGPKAETRIWLVIDLGYDRLREKPGYKDSLYLDLNGNGDLTVPGGRVPVEVVTTKHFEWVVKREVETHWPRFKAPDIVTRGGKKYTGLTADVLFRGFQRTTLQVDVPGRGIQSIGPVALEGLLRLGDSPESAPIIHFDGPLTMRVRMMRGLMNCDVQGKWWYEEEPLVRGQECELVAEIGTPGVGAGTFALLTANIPPADVHPIAEVEFPHRDPGKAAIRRKFSLTERCCGTLFKGLIRVPEDAALGRAQVTLSFPGWDKGAVSPGSGAILVRDVAPAKAEYGIDSGLSALKLVEALGGTFERNLIVDTKPVTKIDLGSTKVADDDLRHLVELRSLRFLNLRSTAVSDKGLACLQGLDGLEIVDVSATKVTEKGKTQFLEKHPKAKFGALPK